MNIKNTLMGAAAGVALMTGASTAFAAGHEEITVAYFLEWPMPFQFAKVNGTYDEEMGVKVNWVSFATGPDMSAALASGDVDIAVSLGIPPLVIAASQGQDMQAIDVAVSYSDNDNCVVSAELEIDASSAGELNGKKVAVPLGTAAHYGFLRQMDHFGVDVSSLDVVDMAPADGAAAIAQGAVDMACGWGGALRRMTEYGNVLLTGAEKEELGILVFDGTIASSRYVAENPDLVAKFLQITAEANTAFNNGSRTLEMLPVIANDAGMDIGATAATMQTFYFPDVETQLSDAWLGGAAPTFMKGVADVFVASGAIPSSLDSYEGAVNTGPLMAVNEM